MEYTKANGQDVQRSFFLSFRFLFVFFFATNESYLEFEKIARKREGAFFFFLLYLPFRLLYLFSTRIVRLAYASFLLLPLGIKSFLY